MIIAETGKVYIRNFLSTDVEDVFAYRSLEEVAKYQYWEPHTKEQTLLFIEQCKDSNPDIEEKWNGFALICKERNQLIGDCAFRVRNSMAEVGCNISPLYQNQGYAREALLLLFHLCFHRIGVTEIIGITDSHNIASVKLMESLGMTKDERFEEKIISKGLWSIEHKYVIKKSF